MWAVDTTSSPKASWRRKSRYEGILVRHARGCRSRSGGCCSCEPGFQAQVWSARERKTLRKTFPTLTAARAWRHESQTALRNGTLRSTSQLTLTDAASTGGPRWDCQFLCVSGCGCHEIQLMVFAAIRSP